jgi:Tfp pilus assembly protein PilN
MMRRIELLPESYREQRRIRRMTALVVMAGLFVVLLLTIWFVRLNFQISDAKDELASVQAENDQLRAQIAQLQTFADLQAEVERKRIALETVMAGDLDWPVLMTEVAMAVPGEVWLRTMNSSAGDTEGSTPAPTETAPIDVSAKESVGRINFEGSSLSLPGVAKWLIRQQLSRTFEAVYLADAVEAEIGGQKAFNFTSSLELNRRAFSDRFTGDLP